MKQHDFDWYGQHEWLRFLYGQQVKELPRQRMSVGVLFINCYQSTAPLFLVIFSLSVLMGCSTLEDGVTREEFDSTCLGVLGGVASCLDGASGSGF